MPRSDLTPLEQQLVAECEKLITIVRVHGQLPYNYELLSAAGEVEDFIVNNCGDD